MLYSSYRCLLQQLQKHRWRHSVTMTTPTTFRISPTIPGAYLSPQPPRYLKCDVYSDPAVFDAVDQHAINVWRFITIFVSTQFHFLFSSLLTPTSVILWFCLSLRTIKPKRLKPKSQNHQTWRRNSPSRYFAHQWILGQKVKGQGRMVRKCKKAIEWPAWVLHECPSSFPFFFCTSSVNFYRATLCKCANIFGRSRSLKVQIGNKLHKDIYA